MKNGEQLVADSGAGPLFRKTYIRLTFYIKSERDRKPSLTKIRSGSKICSKSWKFLNNLYSAQKWLKPIEIFMKIITTLVSIVIEVQKIADTYLVCIRSGNYSRWGLQDWQFGKKVIWTKGYVTNGKILLRTGFQT